MRTTPDHRNNSRTTPDHNNSRTSPDHSRVLNSRRLVDGGAWCTGVQGTREGGLHFEISTPMHPSSFQAERVLQNNTQTKTVVLLGHIGGQRAIVSVEKAIFPADFVVQSLSDVHLINTNDVYSWNTAMHNASVKVNVICPASDTHVRKYSAQKYHMVQETPQMYQSVVRDYIESQRGSRIQWVHNILYHGQESESVVHHNEHAVNGYVLLPDMKWDGQSLRNLYLVAIVQRADLASIRDLTGGHVQYLESMYRELQQKVHLRYGLAPDQLRFFVHYQPSYYHLHIHIVNIGHPGLGDGLNAGKAILLEDILENLRLDAAYYQKRTMCYQLGENHPLWAKFESVTGESP